MFRRDYLKKQIDELGKTLRKILELVGGNNSMNVQELEQLINKQTNGKTDFSLANFLIASEKGTLETFIKNKNLSTDHIEQSAEIFYRLGRKSYNNSQHDSIGYLRTSLELFDYLNRINQVYSLEIEFKIIQIEDLIEGKI